jgi:chemotaxis protein methyltransferase CheR
MSHVPPALKKLLEDNEQQKGSKGAMQKLADIARELTGVQLTEKHRDMMLSRLQKRLQELGLKDLDAYLDFFAQNRASETPFLIGQLTTHHTFFFREFGQFEFLQTKLLPQLLPLLQKRPDKTLKVWSAACSRGQEVYSLAMFLDFHLKRMDPSLKFKILGTDVDPGSVKFAQNGVYPFSEIKEIPMQMLGTHWAKGTGEIKDFVKVKPSLRELCHFRTINLQSLGVTEKMTDRFDVVFCRNVFIYFSPEQIQAFSRQILKQLEPHGHFFIGISETLSGLKLPIKSVSGSVYQQLEAGKATESNKVEPKVSVSKNNGPLRVLCVDDSPSILALLKKILSKEHDFEVVGTAANGLEAAKQVEALKPDIMTLDIHMPEQTGIEYLRRNFKTGHVPVVMITSVSREDSGLAGQALQYGASDFIEKPALTNLQEKAEEIRMKLRVAQHSGVLGLKQSMSLDKEIQKKQELFQPETAVRLLIGSLSSRQKMKWMLDECRQATEPPIVLVLDGAKDALLSATDVLKKDLGVNVLTSDQVPQSLEVGKVYAIDLKTQLEGLRALCLQGRRVSMCVFGDVTKASVEKLLAWDGAHLILEDIDKGKGAKLLMDIASEVVPVTSFEYISSNFLSKKPS